MLHRWIVDSAVCPARNWRDAVALNQYAKVQVSQLSDFTPTFSSLITRTFEPIDLAVTSKHWKISVLVT